MVLTLDKKDPHWAHRISVPLKDPQVIFILGHRFELEIFPGDSPAATVATWFERIMTIKPVFVQYAMPIAICVVNNNRVAVFKNPCQAAIEKLRAMSRVLMVKDFADIKKFPNAKIPPPRPNLIQMIREKSENPLDFLTGEVKEVDTFKGILELILTSVAYDLSGAFEASRSCSECTHSGPPRDLVNHYVTVHMGPASFFRPSNDAERTFACSVCGKFGFSEAALADHVSAAHESRVIDMILRAYPAAARVFEVRSPERPMLIDPVWAVDQSELSLWRRLAIAERASGIHEFPQNTDLAEFILELASGFE